MINTFLDFRIDYSTGNPVIKESYYCSNSGLRKFLPETLLSGKSYDYFFNFTFNNRCSFTNNRILIFGEREEASFDIQNKDLAPFGVLRDNLMSAYQLLTSICDIPKRINYDIRYYFSKVYKYTLPNGTELLELKFDDNFKSNNYFDSIDSYKTEELPPYLLFYPILFKKEKEGYFSYNPVGSIFVDNRADEQITINSNLGSVKKSVFYNVLVSDPSDTSREYHIPYSLFGVNEGNQMWNISKSHLNIGI